MDSLLLGFFSGVILWIIISLPFIFLAYCVFMIRENRKYHYGAVYVRSLIGLALFIAIVSIYYLLPAMLRPEEVPFRQGSEHGVFVDKLEKDTLVLQNNQVTVKFAKKGAEPIQGNYRIMETDESFTGRVTYNPYVATGFTYGTPSFAEEIVHHFGNSNVVAKRPVMEFSYRKALEPRTSGKQTKKKRKEVEYQFVTERYQLTFDKNYDEIILKSLDTYQSERHLVRIQ